MNIFISVCRGVPGLLVAVALSGCSDAVSQINAPVAGISRVGMSGTKVISAGRTRSWMSPDAAKQKRLLYVSVPAQSVVYVYSYPQMKPVGTLGDINHPLGLCTDKAGDVFVVDRFGYEVLEYAHGGSTPIAILGDPGYEPNDCSVDPTTGNLAVANLDTVNGGPGGISIYLKARATKIRNGPQKVYTDPSGSLYNGECLTYDGQGNLFLDGVGSEGSGFAFHEFAELPVGGHSLTDITVGASIQAPGGVQWDGQYISIGDNDNSVVYRTSVVGASASVIGTTTLAGTTPQIFMFLVDGKHLIAPVPGAGFVGIWGYPTGGQMKKTLQLVNAYGVVLSKK